MALNTLTGKDTYITSSQYDSAGRLRSQAFGNGVIQTRNYNAWNTSGGRLQNMTAGTLQNLSYTYDSVGNILSITDSLAGPQVQNFTYDSLDRLTSADAVSGLYGLYSETYGYDANTGNLASKGGNSYTYGDANHAHAVTSLNNGNTYSYDANGNQTTRVIGTDTFLLSYDAENRLTTVLKNGQPLASFTYDGDGLQVAATVNGVTTKYVGGIYEVEGTNVTKYYLTGMNRVAMRVNGVLSYLLQDHLGSTALVTDNLGNVVSEQRYKAWGETRYSSSTANTDYLYTGQREVSDIGLYFYNARWYDKSLGRFVQPDPIIPDPSNSLAYDRYQYVYSNPVRYMDSSGHCIDGITTFACIAIISGIVLKAIDYGWTAWDTYQSGRVLANPNASREDKMLAGLNVGLAIIFEAAEPDDLLPVGLPLDDVGRRAVMKGAREAFEEGGEVALEKFLRGSLGGYSDDVIEKIGLGKAMDPNKLNHIFNNPEHHLDDLVNAFGGNQQSAYNAVWREFSNVAGNYSASELRKGIQITVNGITLTARGVVVDGVAKIGTFFVP